MGMACQILFSHGNTVPILPWPRGHGTGHVNCVPPDGFFGIQIYKIPFWLGLHLDPTGETYDAPQTPIVGWGGEYPLPIPYPLDTFGIEPQCLALSMPIFLSVGTGR